jgi:hypothetical protein
MNGLFHLGFPTKNLYAFLICPIRATCPVHLTFLHVITLEISDEAYKLCSSSLRSLLQPPTPYSLLGPNILLSTLLSQHPQTVSFP